MFAEVAARLGRYADAEALLHAAWNWPRLYRGATHLRHRAAPAGQGAAALAEVSGCLPSSRARPVYRNLMAAVLSRVGESRWQ